MRDAARLGKRNHQVIGQQYLVGKTVGEGAFAKVKYAENLTTKEAVAVKFLSKRRLLRAGMLDHVQQEIRVTSQLKHKHIVDVKDVLVRKEKICIVMEYVDGGTLFDKLVQEGPLEEQSAMRLFKQLLSALGYCHSQGIFHRDLKPENVLLTSDGEVKLSDFGLSAFKTENEGENGFFNSICGTPSYTAPEVLQQRGYFGAPADVWSLGVVLYVMLAGRLPFADRSLSKLVQKITSGVYELPKQLSAAGKDLLQRMLTPNPKNRTTIAEIQKHPWITKGAVSDVITLPKNKLKTDEKFVTDRSSVRKSLFTDSAGENLMKRMRLESKSRTTKTATEDSAETIAFSALEDKCVDDTKELRSFARRERSDSAECLTNDEA